MDARLGDLVLYCANFSSVRETVRTTMKGTLGHLGTRGKAHQDSYPYFMFIIMQGMRAGGCNTCLGSIIYVVCLDQEFGSAGYKLHK